MLSCVLHTQKLKHATTNMRCAEYMHNINRAYIMHTYCIYICYLAAHNRHVYSIHTAYIYCMYICYLHAHIKHVYSIHTAYVHTCRCYTWMLHACCTHNTSVLHACCIHKNWLSATCMPYKHRKKCRYAVCVQLFTCSM